MKPDCAKEWSRKFLRENFTNVFLTTKYKEHLEDVLFDQVNFEYTKSVIQQLNAKTIIYYSTAELWNNYVGEISLELPYNYHPTGYMNSKFNITNYLKQKFNNILIAYPFNFNSKYRSSYFLFGKVIDSIINKKVIELGDTYYYRELIHPSFVVNKSLNQKTDEIIGTGQLIFINDFIKKLYNAFDMKYDQFVNENITTHSIYRKNIFYCKSRETHSEESLFKLMVKEIEEIKNETSK
jgi:hypothetical protein